MNRQPISMPKITVLYARLSQDDELQGPSNSIVNQRQLLQDYAERHGLTPYVHIEDDGYSGTRWDRPGWQELIAKVEADEVACICIKDGSRLGRDYLRVGLYRELFREKGVRLIAINDNYDSAKGEDDFTPFREIMAEWYARDTSRKIKAALHAKGSSGKPLTCAPIYGYKRSTEDKNLWLVDEPAAEVVRRIYRMALEGMGVYQIARTLASEKVEKPSYYISPGDYVAGGQGLATPYSWSTNTVAGILSKPEYAGHTVNFRTTKESYTSKKSKQNPQEEWKIFPNTHEPIIEQEMFDTVQRLRATPRRIDSIGEANPLTGLLFCADCGSKLYNTRRASEYNKAYRNGKAYMKKFSDHYTCSKYKMAQRTFTTACSQHYVRTEVIREMALKTIERVSSFVRDKEDEFVEKIRELSTVQLWLVWTIC